jgi:phage internal scaffolding protein
VVAVLVPLTDILEDIMEKIKHRALYGFDADEHSLAHSLECRDVSLAVQAQKDEADINTIVRNFGVTGKLPENVRVPSYGDFDIVTDYRSAIEVARAAEKSFMAMSAEVRARFENDPQQFLDFCENPANLEEMRKLGLAVPAPQPSESEAS